MLQMVCNGCGRVAEKTEDVTLWLNIQPAIGGDLQQHSCSAVCSDKVSRHVIKVLQAARSELTVAQSVPDLKAT